MKDAIYTHSLDVKSETTDDTVVLIPFDNKTDVVVINDIGIIIYNYINGKNTCSEIALIISTDYDASYDNILDDVIEFCSEMKKKGFIEQSNCR